MPSPVSTNTLENSLSTSDLHKKKEFICMLKLCHGCEGNLILFSSVQCMPLMYAMYTIIILMCFSPFMDHVPHHHELYEHSYHSNGKSTNKCPDVTSNADDVCTKKNTHTRT